MTNSFTRISVIIPSIGREKYLRSTLQDLIRQDLPKTDWECIIVTQSELQLDFFRQCIELEGVNLRVFYSKEPNANLARNIGIFQATSPVILLLDDDVVISNPSFLHNHLVNLYANPTHAGVVGQFITPPSVPITSKLPPKAKHSRLGWLWFSPTLDRPYSTRVGVSGNLSFYREKALAIGGFDANFIKGAIKEEAEFGLRYTDRWGPFLYSPDCGLIHIGASTGGARNEQRPVPDHHLFGQWYFLLSGIKNKKIWLLELPSYSYNALATFFPRRVRANPKIFMLTIIGCVAAFFRACSQLFRGPRTMDTLDHNFDYHLILQAGMVNSTDTGNSKKIGK